MSTEQAKRGTRKRKINVHTEEEEEEEEDRVEEEEERSPLKKFRKAEIYEAWRIAESAISTVSELDVDHKIVEADQVLEDDNKLKLWWYDAFEKRAEGAVYLFGKVLNKTTNNYVSCSVKIKQIKREVYILPRPFRLDSNLNQTTQKVTMDDVKDEISEVLKKRNILEWEFDVCSRKYAFGLADVPSLAEYLLVKYDYNQSELRSTLNGQTFSHVFGTDTGPLEHVLLKCDIMGPCWLTICDPSFPEKKETWSKVNVKVDGLDKCSTVKDDNGELVTKGPPLTIMSINLETFRNRQKDTNEIIMASVYTCPEVDIDNTISLDSLACSRFSVVRKLPQEAFPETLQDTLAEFYAQREHLVQLERTEMGLINYLLAKIHVIDPDVIVGHNFAGIQIETLLNRIKSLKIPYWHKIGRMHTQKLPKLNQYVDTFAHELDFMSGRLLCDTFIASKDLINAKSYNLSELCKTQFNILREEIKPEEIVQFYQSSETIQDLVCHCSFDAYLSLKLMFKLQILPLTKQFTNLSGNKWSKSIYGARADRNEHLLLHTFYKAGYVYPNKYLQYSKKKGQEVSNIESELHDSEDAEKAKFSGGLVLEPKTGYYDHFVILLDFNSLYPSIIQEYNVCFTTRDNLEVLEENHDDGNATKGVLPELVKVLVEKRREIKKLIKDSSISETQRAQYDIQQMALKLTANSMYGCLGSSFSRFYAKDLAMFITFMGRTILKSTVDVAEEMGLDVIYGDTDSIMINTKHSDFEKAKNMALGLKDIVNERYRLLEIGIDGYFKHTLLLRKKKYAALVLEEKENGQFVESIHSKGLDLVRRDWCDLSHDISGHVLKLILNSKSDSNISNELERYLRTIKGSLSDNSQDLSRFVIRRRLNKPLSEYDNLKGRYHIDVARKMRQAGINVRVGDVVPYVMCRDKNRSIPTIPEDVLFGKAKLDINWYLSQQILPPISRLCVPIHDITDKKLASALGINDDDDDDDAIDIQEVPIKEEEETEANPEKYSGILTIDTIQDEKDIGEYKLVLKCSKCSERNTFEGPVRRDRSGNLTCGLLCACCGAMNIASIEAQVNLEIRRNIDKYYRSPFICNDEWCRTVAYDTMVIHSQNCPNIGCRGRLIRKFSDSLLYSRLSKLYNLFDTSAIESEKYNDSELETINDIIETYQPKFSIIKQCIEDYQKISGFRFIRFKDIFDENSLSPMPENNKTTQSVPEDSSLNRLISEDSSLNQLVSEDSLLTQLASENSALNTVVTETIEEVVFDMDDTE